MYMLSIYEYRGKNIVTRSIILVICESTHFYNNYTMTPLYKYHIYMNIVTRSLIYVICERTLL